MCISSVSWFWLSQRATLLHNCSYVSRFIQRRQPNLVLVKHFSSTLLIFVANVLDILSVKPVFISSYVSVFKQHMFKAHLHSPSFCKSLCDRKCSLTDRFSSLGHAVTFTEFERSTLHFTHRLTAK